MRVVDVQVLAADGGYRVCRFVKVTTDEGLVGWSEYYDQLSQADLTSLILHHGRSLIEHRIDPCSPGLVSSALTATTRLTAGGVQQQTIAALENACLDIQGKAAGLPVSHLFGGPFRTRVPVYWTHCGSLRVWHAAFFERELGMTPVRSLEDLTSLGRQARRLGLRAVKTNPVSFRPDADRWNGGFRIGPRMFTRRADDSLIADIEEQLAALRAGIGPDADLMLDVSFSQRTEGAVRLARRLEGHRLRWLELDTADPEALAFVRHSSRTPVASLESLYGLTGYRPFLQQRSVDVAIVDVLWNGFWQANRIATLADAYDTDVAPHNMVGELGNLISAHFCAAIPNFSIMELRVDEAPWTRDYVTNPTVLDKGELVLPSGPGWGSDIDEEAVKDHPPRTQSR
ncbi:mandelate racemase/muconate lactonizing enzyme family protein [Streptomyces antimycoticus]|uniref:mandelate racemase/muconate lactonizing enzyme family protein n=1 Tax=Streptomyces TaxID=1883 RepID=UPI0034423C01